MRNIDKFERYLRGKKWTPLSEYYSSNAFNKLNSQRKIIFFIVPIVVIWNSQYWNIKKCLKCWPYFSCTSKCECIFFSEVTKFFSVQVRIIARAGASARAPSCLWHWALPSCFKTRATETRFYTMEFFFSFTRIILYTFRKIPHNFFLICARISSIMNAKKISKFEREEKSNGNPLLHHGIFFSFHENYPIYIQKDSL